MSPWELYKLVLLLQILFPGKNLTFCETGGQKGYTRVGPGYRSEHRYEGRPGQGHRAPTPRGSHYGPRRPYDTFESPSGRPDYGTVRSKDRVYYTSLDKQGYHTSQRTSTAHCTLIDIDITNKRSTGKVKYYWDEENETEVFTPRDPYLIARVLKGDKVIWKAKDGNYPVMVSVGVNEKGRPRLTVLYPGQEDHHLKSYRSSTDRQALTGREHRPAHPVDYRYRPVRHDPHYDPGYDRGSDLVILDIRTSGDTEEFKYYHDIENNMLVFTANHPYAFHSIVKGDRVLWRAKGDLYPVKVTVGVNKRGKPRITVFYPREDMYTPPTPLQRVKRPPTVPTPPVPAKVKPSVKTVELDIQNKETTDRYDYFKDDFTNTVTYTCKEGYGFISVNQGEKHLWRADNGIITTCTTTGTEDTNGYANKVILKPTAYPNHIVTIYFPDETNVMFKKFLIIRPWQELKIGPYSLDPFQHPQDVKVTTKCADGTTGENDTTKYRVYKREGAGDIYTYTFNENVKCILITFKEKQVWKRESDDDNLDSFSYNKNYNAFIIYQGLEYVKYALDSNTGFWKGGHRQPIIKLTTEDRHGNTNENDASRYYVSNPYLDTYEIKFKDSIRCIKITHLDKVVWKQSITDSNSNTISGTPVGGIPMYPKSILYDKTDRIFRLKFESGSALYTMNARGKWEKLKVPEEVKVTTQGSTAENDIEKYTVYKIQGASEIYSFKFNDRVKCTRITHDGNEVWNKLTNDSYPSSFLYNKTDNYFVLYKGLEIIKFTLDRATSTWKGSEKEQRITVTTEGSTSENDTDKYIVSSPFPDYFLYKFNSQVKCTKITHDGNEVWKSDDSSTPGPQYFSYNMSDNIFMLYFGLECIKFTLNASGSWIGSQRFPFITIITEDSDGSVKENDTSKYRITKKGDMYTYLFNDGAMCTKIKYHLQVVWKYMGNPAELPKSLFIHTKARFFFIKSDRGYRLFMFATNDDRWTSKPLKNMDNIVASDIKVLTKADSDSQGEEMPALDYEFKNHDFCFEYRFKEGKKCYGLEKGDEILHRYDEGDDGKRFPSAIYVLSDLSTFSVYPHVSFYSKPFINENQEQKNE